MQRLLSNVPEFQREEITGVSGEGGEREGGRGEGGVPEQRQSQVRSPQVGAGSFRHGEDGSHGDKRADKRTTWD